MKVQRNTLLRAFLAVLVVAAVAAPTAFASDLRSPDTQDAAKAGQWGRVSDMLLPDTQDAAKAGQPASAIKMQSPDTQDAAEGVRRNGAKARAATYANIRSLPPKVRPRP